MVQPFKCDTCRARKVKCDRKRPVCAPCMVKDRPCTYPTESDPFFVVQLADAGSTGPPLTLAGHSGSVQQSNVTANLQITRSKTLDGGQGFYQTLKSKPARHKILATVARNESSRPIFERRDRMVQRETLPIALSHPQSQVISRWSAAVGSEDSHTDPLHVYARVTPLYARLVASGDTNETLDLAAEYFVTSGEQFQLTRDTNANSACAIGQRALKRLRQALCTQQGDESILLAILLHEVAECFMSLGTFYYTCHTLGCSLLLQQRFKSGSCTDLDLTVLEAVHYEEITEAVLGERDSLFDNPTVDKLINEAIAQGRCGPSETWRLIKHFVKVPRLVRLARCCVANSENAQLVASTTSFAESMYFSGITEDMRQDQASLVVSKTRTRKAAGAVPESFYDFASVGAYSLTIRRASFVSIVCGVLQTLHGLRAASTDIDMPVVEATDVEAASIVAKSVDYAWTVKLAVPLLKLRICVPIHITIGAWARLERRSRDSVQREYARLMQEWELEVSNDFLTLWKGKTDTLDTRIVKAEAFAAGPVTDVVRRKVDWSAVWQAM